MGRAVTITTSKTEDDGLFPVGPASVCVEGPPEMQCYTAPDDFGLRPPAKVIRLRQDLFALLFSAESGGVSGWEIHYTLPSPSDGKHLDELFDVSVSNQSQHGFWRERIGHRGHSFGVHVR